MCDFGEDYIQFSKRKLGADVNLTIIFVLYISEKDMGYTEIS